MKTLKHLLMALLLLCGITANANVPDETVNGETAQYTVLPVYFNESDGLPGTVLSGSSQKQWESGTLNFEKAVSGIRITVFATDYESQMYNNFPITALAELEFYDGDGNKIEYTADDVTTNSLESTEGSLAALCDGDYSTFYHSTWKTGTTPTSTL